MSDKSKLGFNINPKNYDELNSTDNLITSGSDSGWLGKKLQGDNTSTIDLSKINPLFDKELYEKYRPGVNTNDGSVNQDIWGFKCFNSPVSFRNGIYGDTYSIQSIENDDIITGAYDGISIQPCQKNTIHDGVFDSKYYSYKLHSDIIGITHDKCVTSAYTGKMRHPITFNEPTNYQLFSNAMINGSSIENMTLTSTADTKYYCQSYIYNNPSDTDLHIYNGVKIYSEINSKSEYTDEINIVSSKCDTTSSTRPYKVSRITVGTACDNDPILEKESQVSGNCIRMYSTNGNEFNFDHTNDNISSIIITPKTINLSSTGTDNNYTSLFIITQDSLDVSLYNDGIHTKTFRHDGKYLIQTPYDQLYSQSTMFGPVNDIIYIFNDINDTQTTNSDAFGFLLRSSMSDERQPIPDTVGALRIGCDITYTGPGVDLNYKVIGTSITPLSLSTAAIQLNTVHIDDKFKDYNYVWPCAKIVPGSGTFGDGLGAIPTDDIKFVSLNQRDSSHIICDYLTVKNTIKCGNILGSGLAYINPTNNAETELLTVSNENLILPRGNKEVTIGSSDNRLNEIYAYKFIGTADKAKADESGHNIAKTYFNINSNNTITGTTTISRPGDVLRILPNSLDEEASCNINITINEVDMRYKTTLNVHQQDNTNLACSLSLYAYHNNDVSSFSILPSVESTTSGILNDNVALNIGGKNNYFTNIYCKNFPTITGDKNKTSVGNIRLLAIQSPYIPDIDIYETIGHGSEIQSPIVIDGKEFVIYIATLGTVVENHASIIKLMIDVDSGVVAGKWRLLSSVYITNDRAGIMYIPVLAMRVE